MTNEKAFEDVNWTFVNLYLRIRFLVFWLSNIKRLKWFWALNSQSERTDFNPVFQIFCWGRIFGHLNLTKMDVERSNSFLSFSALMVELKNSTWKIHFCSLEKCHIKNVTWLCHMVMWHEQLYMLRMDDRSKFLSRWIINDSLLGDLDPTFDFWLTYWPL